jgi:hypothetical protein
MMRAAPTEANMSNRTQRRTHAIIGLVFLAVGGYTICTDCLIKFGFLDWERVEFWMWPVYVPIFLGLFALISIPGKRDDLSADPDEVATAQEI